MSFTLWRGVVGMVRPTRRPGTLEELIRILPEGIGVVPLMLNFRAGSAEEFLKSIPQYEQYTAELAEQGVDLIVLTGAPPFMLLGPKDEAALIRAAAAMMAMQPGSGGNGAVTASLPAAGASLAN